MAGADTFGCPTRATSTGGAGGGPAAADLQTAAAWGSRRAGRRCLARDRKGDDPDADHRSARPRRAYRIDGQSNTNTLFLRVAADHLAGSVQDQHTGTTQ